MAGMIESLAYMASFRRKVKRKEFFLSYIVIIALIVVSGNLSLKAFDPNDINSEPLGFICIGMIIYGYWILFAVYVSRIRDTGKSLWLIFLIFVPFVNILFFLYLFFAPSAPDR
jgi:uncharacterized membrane protein YhaH (DUF805 family)